MTSFTRTWNAAYEAIPAQSDAFAEGASRIRDLKTDIQERGEVDHAWAGTADDGAHKKLTLPELAADPTNVTDFGFLYTKNDGGDTELYYEDAAANVIQITVDGTVNLGADSITGAEIVDDAIDSEHIAAGAIDPEHFAASSVETAAINNLAVTAGKIASGTITATQMAANSVDSSELVNGSIDPGHLAALAIETAAIAALAVTTAKIAANAVTGAKIAMGSDAQGDILFYGGVDYERLGPGTSGQALLTGGAAADPAWGNVIRVGTPLVQNPCATNVSPSQAHGLGAMPSFLVTELECLSADLNYSAGNVLDVSAMYTNAETGRTPHTILRDSTNITLITRSTNADYGILNKTTRVAAAIDITKWKITITPYLVG